MMKLKEVAFRLNSWSIQWVITALQTTTPEHRDLQQIMIHIPYYLTVVKVFADVRRAIGEAGYGQWLDLDRLLVQLWESRSICPKAVVRATQAKEKKDTRDCVARLLPETTKRGIIDLVEHSYGPQ
jgi:hypothetical protein